MWLLLDSLTKLTRTSLAWESTLPHVLITVSMVNQCACTVYNAVLMTTPGAVLLCFHPASYASKSYLERKGYLGRSWGCLAVDPRLSSKFMKLTKGG